LALNGNRKYLLGSHHRKIGFLLHRFSHRPLPLGLLFFPESRGSLGRTVLRAGETDPEVGYLLQFLGDADRVLDIAAELDEELLSALTWVILDGIEVIESELFPFEGDGDVVLAEYLSLHGFDQVDARLVGFDLPECRVTLKETTLSLRFWRVIEEFISCSSWKRNFTDSGTLHN
jgi:hypothetical protein